MTRGRGTRRAPWVIEKLRWKDIEFHQKPTPQKELIKISLSQNFFSPVTDLVNLHPFSISDSNLSHARIRQIQKTATWLSAETVKHLAMVVDFVVKNSCSGQDYYIKSRDQAFFPSLIVASTTRHVYIDFKRNAEGLARTGHFKKCSPVLAAPFDETSASSLRARLVNKSAAACFQHIICDCERALQLHLGPQIYFRASYCTAKGQKHVVIEELYDMSLNDVDLTMLSTIDRISIVTSLLYDLRKIHASDVAFWDIKPENALVRFVGRRYEAIWSDFGVAFDIKTVTKDFGKYPSCLVPKELLNRYFRADLWAFGNLLNTLFTPLMDEYPSACSFHEIAANLMKVEEQWDLGRIIDAVEALAKQEQRHRS